MTNIYAYYINVYRDAKGRITESENGIMATESAALHEAIDYVLNYGWRYIETLSNHPYTVDFSQKILDAEFERNNPDDEYGHKHWQAVQDRRIKELTEKSKRMVSFSTGMGCQFREM